MPKATNSSSSLATCRNGQPKRASPYEKNPNPKNKKLEEEWKEIKCPICFDHPHNAVLLICSSNEKGCRPYVCDTSARHSNCFSQYCRSHSVIPSKTRTRPELSHNDDDGDRKYLNKFVSYGGEKGSCGGPGRNPSECPFCRGEIRGWIRLGDIRRFMNSLVRECALESCEFSGTELELRKHARIEHPNSRPTFLVDEEEDDGEYDYYDSNVGDVYIEEEILDQYDLEIVRIAVPLYELDDCPLWRVVSSSDYLRGMQELYPADNVMYYRIDFRRGVKIDIHVHLDNRLIECQINGSFGNTMSVTDSYFNNRERESVNCVRFCSGGEEMKSSSSSGDVKDLLEAIQSSDVVENRVQLLTTLGELEIIDKCEVASLVGALTASVWCRKHLQMTLMSTEESQEEEHSVLFYQLLINLLSYSASCFSNLARNSFSISKEVIPTVESFISELLSVAKDALSAVKRIDAVGSEIQKIAHLVLDAVIQLCKMYCQGAHLGSESLRREEEKQLISSDKSSDTDHAMMITKITVDKLCEIGILAANDGGSLVTILNLSWKGVVTLLQLGKGALATMVDVASVILTLISLANQSLKCAADSWSLKLEEAIQLAEAKRIFLPVKFYLINAVRIISQYPAQAFSVYKEVIGCVISISCFKVCLSKEEHLKFAAEALGEILEPTSFHLLNSILHSLQSKQEERFQVLDWLLGDEIDQKLVPLIARNNGVLNSTGMDHHLRSDARDGTLSLGQVNLYLYLLRSSAGFEDHTKVWIAGKLQWLLDVIMDEDVYGVTLSVQVHMTYASSQDQKAVYQPFLHSILDALKTFMVIMSSNPAWTEIEYFLLQNLMHPHFLCQEIVNDLWCFRLRHAEVGSVDNIIDKLCTLLAFAASAESVVSPGSGLRQIARSICLMVTYGSHAVADRVYNFVAGENKSQNSLSMYTALLMEGFPLNLLPERTRSKAKQRIVTDYFDFAESFTSEQQRVAGFETYGAPVFALSATLQSQQVSLSDTEMKSLKFMVAIISKYKIANDNKLKNIYCMLLSEVLGIISHMHNLYSTDDMEAVILELQNLFISRSSLTATAGGPLFLCKPNLTNFMSGLGHMELVENDDNAKSAAVWGLYHMILREQHWALAHLAMTAFGYFAAHTSCNQLWRFLPPDAALSFDLDSGNEADEERFMSELRGYLQKESASLVAKCTPDHISMLAVEGLKLKDRVVEQSSNVREVAVPIDAMEIDEENQGNKKRKLPDGISEGVELLQNGLKVMSDGLSQWEQNQIDLTGEIREKFLTHFSRLEDVVSNLVSLTGDC
ncbi:OLC1v1019389C1 [Oldenlandia corymbosa var. corymbosa]|uniref:OLC1v1019389C1 n=1 Tax=Oldenlandia corymbosa var. corymbosa TaxID=529605 RepID=A0AAV1EDU7_OLDCO|nr:OLC1v1019389C1 [Oldenlandia corymbosa var. corymbosa]